MIAGLVCFFLLKSLKYMLHNMLDVETINLIMLNLDEFG